VHIDLTANSVIRVEDVGDVPVPAGHGNYYPEVQGEAARPQADRDRPARGAELP
jgi:hypothetical protein